MDWQVQETLPRYVYFDMIRGVFKTLSNIYDEAFCENSERLTNISYPLIRTRMEYCCHVWPGVWNTVGTSGLMPPVATWNC